MNKKFDGKYRTASSRLPGWDYTNSGKYFITICTHERIHFFGEITDGKMSLSPIGELAERFWAEIPDHFPFVELGEFVIMPNHMHGILIINRPSACDDDNNDGNVQTLHCNNNVQTLHCNVSTPAIPAAPATPAIPATPATPAESQKNYHMAKIAPKSGSVSTIIRSYKSIVTREARKINPDFAWQARFYDHIIRDHASFQRITSYIAENPANWSVQRSGK